jgi:hypothetical protein
MFLFSHKGYLFDAHKRLQNIWMMPSAVWYMKNGRRLGENKAFSHAFAQTLRFWAALKT